MFFEEDITGGHHKRRIDVAPLKLVCFCLLLSVVGRRGNSLLGCSDKTTPDDCSVLFMSSLCAGPYFPFAALRAPAHISLRKDGCAMGDAVAVLYGIFVFVLLMLYVRGCEKV
jgi:hypothetical protein